MSAARRIDVDRLRLALGRVLAPALVAKVVEEATIAEDEAVPTPRRATPEEREAVRAWARRESKR